VTRLKRKLGSICLEIVLQLMQDWCTVCVECTVGSEIVLAAPEGDMAHVESRFDLF
jgi:hypothetical protein